MPQLESRPDGQAIACSIKLIKEASGFSNNRFGKKVGVSDLSISHYINGKGVPNIDIIGKMIALTQDAREIPNDKREELRERLVQAFVPYVIYAAKYQAEYGGISILERGARLQKKYQSEREKYIKRLRSPERRARLSAAKMKQSPASSKEAQVIDLLVGVGRSYLSYADLGQAMGVTKQAIYQWKRGERMSLKRREQLIELEHQAIVNTK